jgi:glutaredoxin
MNKIEIYTNKTCPYCKNIKEKLEAENIKFIDKDTSEFEDEWNQIVNCTAIPTVPTIKHNNEYYLSGRDFRDPDHLMQLLKVNKKPTIKDSEILLERLKTLSYSINMAFGRVDNLLREIETKLNTKEDETL